MLRKHFYDSLQLPTKYMKIVLCEIKDIKFREFLKTFYSVIVNLLWKTICKKNTFPSIKVNYASQRTKGAINRNLRSILFIFIINCSLKLENVTKIFSPKTERVKLQYQTFIFSSIVQPNTIFWWVDELFLGNGWSTKNTLSLISSRDTARNSHYPKSPTHH